jgi:acetate kinase
VRVLAVNAGSSSLKLGLLDGDELVERRDLVLDQGAIDTAPVRDEIASMPTPDAVGHRIVHGGSRFRGPVALDGEVESALRDIADLAPLHQAKSLEAARVVREVLGEVPAVACFDTAFHATLPAAAQTYALPLSWRERYGLRRFGFHGLSHGYVARLAADMLGHRELRLVSCHLGAGASLAAVAHGRSVDTTMGFTPLEGLVMATRSGSVDPGLLLWLLEREEFDEQTMAATLEHSSGLTALAGTGDMREILLRAGAGDEDAELARDTYVHRLRAAIAAMAAALGGVEAVAFTGGVGENSSEIRTLACAGLGFIGIEIDDSRNKACDGSDADISATGSRVRTIVLRAREDLEIARQTRSVLGAQDPG